MRSTARSKRRNATGKVLFAHTYKIKETVSYNPTGYKFSELEWDNSLNSLLSFFNLQPYAGFGYSITKYNASGSKGRAAKKNALVDSSFSLANMKKDYTNNVKEISASGDVIDYTREVYDVYCGLAASFYLFDRLTLTADVNVSPFVKINAKDHHYLTDYQVDMYYLDIMKGFFQKWQFGAAADVKIFGGLSAGLLFNFNLLAEIKGDDYKSTSDSNYKRDYAYSSSTSSYSWEASLYARYRFDFGPKWVRKARVHNDRTPKVRNGKVKVKQY